MLSLSPVWVLSFCALAAQAVPEQETAGWLSRRAAEADAMRKLGWSLGALPVKPGVYLHDLFAECPGLQRATEATLDGVVWKEPSWTADGVCRITVELDGQRVIDALRAAVSQQYAGTSVVPSDLDDLAAHLADTSLTAVGVGVARGQLPPGLPAGGPAADAAAQSGAAPALWESIGRPAELIAVEAARRDARRRLAERILDLRLTPALRARDFAPQRDVLVADLSARLLLAREVAEYLHDDLLIAEVELAVSTDEIAAAIGQLHRRFARHAPLPEEPLEQIVARAVAGELRAVGFGVPPGAYVRRAQQTIGVEAPEWASRWIEAKGQSDIAGSGPDARLRAAVAAERDARGKLVEAVRALPLEEGETVESFVAGREHLTLLVGAIILDAAVRDTRLEPAGATATIEVHGMLLWRLVRDERRSTVIPTSAPVDDRGA